MSRVQQWKRRKFDEILSNPSRLLLTRLLVLALLAGAVAEAWFARTTMVERMDWAGTQMRRLVALEDSVEYLRTTASPEHLDSARMEGFRGVFEDWDSLATWLELQRRSALKHGWALEWKLTEPGNSLPLPLVRQQAIELHLTLSESDFQRGLSFIRSTTESDTKRSSLVGLQGIGDDRGVTELTWTLLVWVRLPRG
ncbi:MAG: hypothetical protein AAB214_14495 [Fibrobacterota bacterium]